MLQMILSPKSKAGTDAKLKEDLYRDVLLMHDRENENWAWTAKRSEVRKTRAAKVDEATAVA